MAVENTVALVVDTRIVVKNRVKSSCKEENGDLGPSFSASSRTFHGHNVVIAVSAAAKAADMANKMAANAIMFFCGGWVAEGGDFMLSFDADDGEAVGETNKGG